MRFVTSVAFASALLAAPSLNASAGPKVHHGPTSPRILKSHSAAQAKPRVTAQMASERATQIQTALIKSGYLNGAPTGVWDASSEAAMARLQGDNGWQTKFVPDARGLSKLGLGPGSAPAPELAAAGDADAGSTAGDAFVPLPSNH